MPLSSSSMISSSSIDAVVSVSCRDVAIDEWHLLFPLEVRDFLSQSINFTFFDDNILLIFQ